MELIFCVVWLLSCVIELCIFCNLLFLCQYPSSESCLSLIKKKDKKTAYIYIPPIMFLDTRTLGGGQTRAS